VAQAALALVAMVSAATAKLPWKTVVAEVVLVGVPGAPATAETAALVLWLLDIGLRNGSLCTNRRTRHGAHSHRGQQQRHIG
jgi:hypothetical protein